MTLSIHYLLRDSGQSGCPITLFSSARMFDEAGEPFRSRRLLDEFLWLETGSGAGLMHENTR
jgi:hypothetical protein